jgi:hypothetical protein
MSKTEIWYDVSWGKISELRVVKETEHCIWLDQRNYRGTLIRQNKNNDLFRDLKSAEQEILNRLRKSVASCKSRLSYAEAELAAFKPKSEGVL